WFFERDPVTNAQCKTNEHCIQANVCANPNDAVCDEASGECYCEDIPCAYDYECIEKCGTAGKIDVCCHHDFRCHCNTSCTGDFLSEAKCFRNEDCVQWNICPNPAEAVCQVLSGRCWCEGDTDSQIPCQSTVDCVDINTCQNPNDVFCDVSLGECQCRGAIIPAKILSPLMCTTNSECVYLNDCSNPTDTFCDVSSGLCHCRDGLPGDVSGAGVSRGGNTKGDVSGGVMQSDRSSSGRGSSSSVSSGIGSSSPVHSRSGSSSPVPSGRGSSSTVPSGRGSSSTVPSGRGSDGDAGVPNNGIFSGYGPRNPKLQSLCKLKDDCVRLNICPLPNDVFCDVTSGQCLCQ
ncbi:cell death abnormality protein 1, partial [Biomphalaria pfeifferi]